MVAFFRFGSVSSSKSQLMNSLINEKHQTFFHRHCFGSIKKRILMDGVVEVAWFCPSGETTDNFSECVAFCNLHGDAAEEPNKQQLEILTEMSSVNVVLVSDHENKTNIDMIKKLFKDPKPLICLHTEDESDISGNNKGKYRIGLKDRNQAEVSKNLRTAIKECVLKSESKFRLEDLNKNNDITTDENDPECNRGRKSAKNIMIHLEETEQSKLKEVYLPCQGNLWHEWCQMNKDLHQLQENNLEIQKNEKQSEMKGLRGQQFQCGPSNLMKYIISKLMSLTENEKVYFLKWIEILLEKITSDNLSELYHKYNEKWTEILDLQRNHKETSKTAEEQQELQKVSEKLSASMFGLEHIFREMGQIYEAYMSVPAQQRGSDEEVMTSFPKLAAELLQFGFPLELMDGDAAHVPLIWVRAVLDELIKKVGDQKVFVLSVLGIQSSGKSTMLNAMFGLQFAVSAGRCTRGAFMQLLKVSEEMKIKLKFDYILAIDTEGLRALELLGKSTRHHDNELATFVVGIGNMTLINIFGENPAEMEDILQIVVQAFLRMKMVRLKPSCMFVHQNVGDITAGERTMEGRRRLQKKLDDMTKLAATEEDCDAKCFNDVIEFNLQDDIHYIAQLWEGSPPMAPPNPAYSRNIQLLKKEIFKKASMLQCFTLSEFKTHICDLWEALLNENFVFSFRNTLEIAIYRKLETEFGKWTWSLRKAMLETEEKLLTRIENKQMKNIEITELYKDVSNTKKEVEKSMKLYFEENKYKDILIQWKKTYETRIEQLLKDLESDASRNLDSKIQQQKAQETLEQMKIEYDKKLFSDSKTLALKLKNNKTDEKILEQEFYKTWNKLFTDLNKYTKPKKCSFSDDFKHILFQGDNQASLQDLWSQEQYKDIDTMRDFSRYMILNSDSDSERIGGTSKSDEKDEKNKNKKNVECSIKPKYKFSAEDQDAVRNVILNVFQEANRFIDTTCNKIRRHGYRDSYIHELTELIKKEVQEYQDKNKKFRLKKDFTLDLCLCVCDKASDKIIKSHEVFTDKNDIRIYLEKQKPQYYSVFQNYCKGSSSIKVFSDLICINLQEPILQSAYNITAIELSTQMRSDMPEFNGNRSQLEKHILKSLAEEENFKKYIQYINDPKEHFKQFIKTKVHEYITDNNTKVLNLFKGNIKYKQERVINAVKLTTNEISNKGAGANAETWLSNLNHLLTDELHIKEINFTDQKEITDFEFLQQLVIDGLTEMMSKLNNRFNNVLDLDMRRFRKKPDEILSEHLHSCCWAQCPFCKAICTNTMEDHEGDHSVPFHRVNGVNGMVYTGTTELCNGFCTTRVQSNMSFSPIHTPDKSVPYKKYKKAGGEYAKWSITPDNTECPYWKWFVCRFQNDLEKHYNGQFSRHGGIPAKWRNFTKQRALESLDEYI